MPQPTMTPEVATERFISALRQRDYTEARALVRVYDMDMHMLNLPDNRQYIAELWTDLPQEIKDELINMDDRFMPEKH